MKTLNLVQGTPDWHAHRATHFNASDAPAMMGCSPYKTRTQLLDDLAGKASAEIDAGTQKRFDDGHRFEAMARPLAESIIGEELFPCVGEDGKLSASFDGLTLMYDTAFEHKTLNDDLRQSLRDGMEYGTELPLHYCVQMEQQCMVSGAERVLFLASKWDGETLIEERHCWYVPNAELRAKIVAGWEQFERDLAEHKPVIATVEAVGHAPDSLPSLHIELTGLVTASNLAEFRDHAIAVFQGISTDLQTDQDFADADKTVKWCGDIETRLKAAKDHALSQTQSIDELFRAIDSISAEARSKRLELEKLVKARKEAVRAEIVYAGRDAIVEHYSIINATLGEHAIRSPDTVGAELNAAIKGKRTITSIRDAVDTTVASLKIAGSQKADQVRACVAVMAEHAKGNESLFADRVALCASRSPDDLRNLITVRVSEHEAKQKAKEEADRERIRAEEVAKLAAETAAKELAAAKQSTGAELSPAAQSLYEVEGAQRFTEHHRGSVVTKQPARSEAAPTPAKTRPTDLELIEVLALHYRVHESSVVAWLLDIDFSTMDVAA
jgi:putative phage-type endonuclease